MFGDHVELDRGLYIAALQAGSSSTVTVVVTPTIAGNFTGGRSQFFRPIITTPILGTTRLGVQPRRRIYGRHQSRQPKRRRGRGHGRLPSDDYPYESLCQQYFVNVLYQLPTGAKGTFSVSFGDASGVSPVSSQLNITTTARPVNNRPRPLRRKVAAVLRVLDVVAGNGGDGIGWKSGRRRRLRPAIGAASSFGLMLLQPACGGTTTPTPVSGTPPELIRWWRQRPQGATQRT